jgi:hypothetical protein
MAAAFTAAICAWAAVPAGVATAEVIWPNSASTTINTLIARAKSGVPRVTGACIGADRIRGGTDRKSQPRDEPQWPQIARAQEVCASLP